MVGKGAPWVYPWLNLDFIELQARTNRMCPHSAAFVNMLTFM